MRKILGLLIVLSIYLVFSTALYFSNTYAHEEAHKQFAEYNGCNNYTVSYFMNPSFTCHSRSRNITREDRQLEYVLDGMNEITTYNYVTTWNAILLMGLGISVTIIFVQKD